MAKIGKNTHKKNPNMLAVAGADKQSPVSHRWRGFNFFKLFLSQPVNSRILFDNLILVEKSERIIL
tara:strand:- start:696 stop:893 length:198 start_codon:yes stop_codon:yes gene_type:complete